MKQGKEQEVAKKEEEGEWEERVQQEEARHMGKQGHSSSKNKSKQVSD